MSVKKAAALVLIFAGLGVIIGLGVISLYKRRQPTAGLVVETSPPSVVFVNNVQIGVTPIDKTFPPSEVTVKIIPNSVGSNLSAYQTKVLLSDKVKTVIRRNFGISDKDTAGETVLLLPQSTKEPSLSVATSVPEFASVNLDGLPLGFTPLSIASIPPGDHEITVSAPGFSTRTISARALPGYNLTLNVKLSALPDTPSPSPIPTTPALITQTSTPRLPQIPTPKPTPDTPRPYVEITNTPVGFLRVRQGPGTNFPEIGQVKPGETYPLLESLSAWYHIQVELEATSSGWISTQYAIKYE